MEQKQKLNRQETMRALKKRDGDYCRVPGCKTPTIFTNSNPRTIEHVIPRAKGGTDDLENLEIAHQKCNNWKGDRLYIGVDENGVRILEPLPYREPKSQVQKRPPCETCNEGRALQFGEQCGQCGSLPQPYAFPKYLQRKVKDCNHSTTHCWACVTGHIERQPVIQNLLIGPE